MADDPVDVFISGAGPVGLVLAYALTRLGHSVHLIDSADKSSPNFPMYGRACTLHPRTLEMLDQLDLYDDLLQEGFIGRRSFCYRDGKLVYGRGWTILESTQGQTFYDHALNIRLKYSEDIFRRRLGEMGVKVHAPVKLVDFSLDEAAKDDHQVHVRCQGLDGEYQVHAKYIIGSDGGGSTVRKFAGIPFTGEKHVQHWVRIDGIVKANIPEARMGFGAFESSTHGHVLWVSLDHSATRIGYVLSEAMLNKYGIHMSAADAVMEAKKAVAPFELEFEEVHWHTVYGIQQHIADSFQSRERILLAGDAAHTHSSGSAQGMNTGMHDVCSLSWRLAGVLKGWYRPSVLANYTTERRAAAQELIANDKLVSELISRRIPASLKSHGSDPMVILDEVLRPQRGFALGLGISYAPSFLNEVEGSEPAIQCQPGHRFPDTEVYKNGHTKQPVRLFELTKYNGKFRIIVFTGAVQSTGPRLKALRAQVDEQAPAFTHCMEFLTIIAGTGSAFDEHLGIQRFGRAYWDIDHSAHTRYGIYENIGCIVVLRPDGLLGFTAPLEKFERVVEYLDRFVIPRVEQKKHGAGMNGHATRRELGEFMSENENNLAFRKPVGHEGVENRESGAVGAR